jgi:SAM-dependent methyltransferase
MIEQDLLVQPVTCPLCASADQLPIFAADDVPVQSALLRPDRASALAVPRGRLDVVLCRGCGLAFNRAFDEKSVLYDSNYEDAQGYSPRFRAFADELATGLVQRHRLAGKTVVEIGCGKGEFLAALKRAGIGRAIGFDPACRLDPLHRSKPDLEIHPTLYGPGEAGLGADLVCCRHTLEHTGRPRDLLGLMRRNLEASPGAVVFVEVPDLERILAERAFWDVYYEHALYFSPHALKRLVSETGFLPGEVAKVYGGQYLTIEATIAAGSVASRPNPPPRGLIDLAVAFSKGVDERLEAGRAELARWRAAGRRVAIWGSGSKGVAYLTMMRPQDELVAVVDVNPHRWGRFLAGSGRMIVAPEELVPLRPDVVVVMNPLYIDEIGALLQKLGLRPEIRPA